MNTMKIFLAKQLFQIGNLKFNFNKIIEIYNKAVNDDYDLIIFPEMSITGFPIYEKLLDKKFIKESDQYLEKIIDHTKGKKTRILLGCPYLINEYTTEEGIKKEAKLFNSVILINDGYIDGVSSKTQINKSNLFDEYKFFDKEVVLKSINYENDNFDVLIGDDIIENSNILFIKERDTDFIICLDTEISENIELKKNQLIKIAKWTKKHVIYLNNIGYDFNKKYQFFGETFLIGTSGEIIFENLFLNEQIIKLQTSIINGELEIKSIFNNLENKNILEIISENYSDKKFIYEIKNDEFVKQYKNIKLITFNKNKKSENVEFIDINKYFKNNSILKDEKLTKKFLINSIYNDYIFIQ